MQHRLMRCHSAFNQRVQKQVAAAVKTPLTVLDGSKMKRKLFLHEGLIAGTFGDFGLL
jgi:hypothetical protein